MMRVAVILDTHVPPRAKQENNRDGRLFISRRGKCVAHDARVTRSSAPFPLPLPQRLHGRQDISSTSSPPVRNLYHLTAGRRPGVPRPDLGHPGVRGRERARSRLTDRAADYQSLLSRISTVVCVCWIGGRARRAFAHRLNEQGRSREIIVTRLAMHDRSAPDVATFGSVPVISRAEFDRGIDQL